MAGAEAVSDRERCPAAPTDDQIQAGVDAYRDRTGGTILHHTVRLMWFAMKEAAEGAVPGPKP